MKQSIDANFSKNKCKLQLALITHQRTLHKNNAFILLQQSCKKAAFSVWSVYGAKQGKLENSAVQGTSTPPINPNKIKNHTGFRIL